MKPKIDLVVTRHPGLVEFLKEQDIADDHTTMVRYVQDSAVLTGLHVAGVLPRVMASACASFTEVTLEVPYELKGKELGLDEVRKFATSIITYEERIIRIHRLLSDSDGLRRHTTKA